MIKLSLNCSWHWALVHTYDFDGTIVECSWNDEKYVGDYVVDLEPPFSKHSNVYPPEKRIYVTTEPSLFGHSAKIKEIGEYYFLILSHHEQLMQLPQCHPYQPANKWVEESTPKLMGIGGAISAKNSGSFPGYALRHKILENEHQIKHPGIIYNYRGHWKNISHTYPLPLKDPCMQWFFQLAIENCREPNYFTEKLIDCFAARNVPLYFGDPLIADKFDVRGMIILSDEFWLEQINALTEYDYESRKDFIEINFEKSKEYWNMDYRMVRLIISMVMATRPNIILT